MIQRVPININDIIPASMDVMNHQGIPEDSVIPDKIISLFDEAVVVFKANAKPVAIIKKLQLMNLILFLKVREKMKFRHHWKIYTLILMTSPCSRLPLVVK
ncbi:MAG: hypothetical protein DRQ01_09640 [Ignavibacteriae bacterium]|nr:MAG: hypothetical protein DRQ01_09640 [Ignavibacteriota bacterium]